MGWLDFLHNSVQDQSLGSITSLDVAASVSPFLAFFHDVSDFLLNVACFSLPILLLRGRVKGIIVLSLIISFLGGLHHLASDSQAHGAILYLTVLGKMVAAGALWSMILYLLYSMPFWSGLPLRLRSEQLLSNILNHTSSMIFVLDREFRIEFASKSAEYCLETINAQMAPETKGPCPPPAKGDFPEISALFAPDEWGRFNDLLRRPTPPPPLSGSLNPQTSSSPSSSPFFRLHTGQYVTAHLQILSSPTVLRRPKRYLLTLNDVTDLELARQDLKRQQEQLEQALSYNKSVFSTITDGLVILKPDGTIDQLNPMAAAFLCIDAGQGKNFMAHIKERQNGSAQDRVRSLNKLQRAIQNCYDREGFTTFDLRLNGKDAPYVLQVMVQSFFSNQEKRCLIVLHNMTKRAEYEERLKSTQDLLSQIADNIDAVLFVTSADGAENLYCSPNAQRLLGVQPEEWCIHNDRSILAWLKPILAAHQNTDPSERFFDHVTDVQDANGKKRFINIRSFIVRGKHGQVAKIAGMAIDITSIHLAKQNIERQHTQLLQKNKALKMQNNSLEHFTYIASHDLGSPLRAIHSYAQLLEEMKGRSLGEEGKTYFRYIYSGINRMRELIDGVLSLTKIQIDPRHVRNTNMIEVLNDILRELAHQPIEKPYSIWVKDILDIQGHDVLIKMLFKNIIENGIKYNRSDQAFIKITAKETSTGIIYEIGDNGIGIRRDNRKRIFNIFQRLHTDQEFPGTGIGLATCRRIMELHHGRIWVRSDHGAGSIFCCYFPKEQTRLKEGA